MNISRIPWKRVLRSNFFIPRTFPSFYSCKKYYSARASRDYLKKWLGGGLNPKHEEIAAFDDDFEALSTENLVSHTRNHSSETKENHKPVLWKINGAAFLADPMKDIINLNGNTAVVVQIEDLDSLTITMLSQIRSTIEAHHLHIVGYSDVPIGLQPFLRPNVNIEDFQIEEEEDQEEQEEQGEEDPKWTVEADKENQKEPPVASPARVAKAGSKLFVGTIRSGQQVYSEEVSAVVLGTVNDGGEVLAQGDIHIYGPAYGRVIAGLGDDALLPSQQHRGSSSTPPHRSKIFIRQFHAALIGIGDAFLIPDDYPQLKEYMGRSVMIQLFGKEEDVEQQHQQISHTTPLSSVAIRCNPEKTFLFSLM